MEDNICSLASVLAPFFGVGNATNVPTSEEFSHASLVEKINYLESENQALQNKLLVLEGNQSSLLSKADYLQTTSDQIGSGVSSIQSLVQGINIPDYTSNFSTISAGIAGVNTTLGTVNANTAGLAQEIASLKTQLDSVADAVQESTAAANSLYSLFVYLPKSVSYGNCTGYEVSLTSPSGIQNVKSKLKDTGDYYSTTLYFNFKGDCDIKYTLPFDTLGRDVDFGYSLTIKEPGQEYLLSSSGILSFNSLSWEQVHSILQIGEGDKWFAVGDSVAITLEPYQYYNKTSATTMLTAPRVSVTFKIIKVTPTRLTLQMYFPSNYIPYFAKALKPANCDSDLGPILGETVSGGSYGWTERACDLTKAGVWNYLDTQIYKALPSDLQRYIPKAAHTVYNGWNEGSYASQNGAGNIHEVTNWYSQTISNHLAPTFRYSNKTELEDSMRFGDWRTSYDMLLYPTFCIE